MYKLAVIATLTVQIWRPLLWWELHRRDLTDLLLQTHDQWKPLWQTYLRLLLVGTKRGYFAGDLLAAPRVPCHREIYINKRRK